MNNHAVAIALTLPQGIPAPQFQLFQAVAIKSSTEPRTGVIVGLEYVTLFTAIANHDNTYGWIYEVDFYFDAPTEKLLEAIEYETVGKFRESKLLAIKGGAR